MTQQFKFGDRVRWGQDPREFVYILTDTRYDRESGWIISDDNAEYLASHAALKIIPHPGWISVNDRLPELDTPVHALLDNHVGIFARCDDDNGSWLWARCYGTSSCDNYGEWLLDDDYQSITHWQPIPEPPGASNPPPSEPQTA